MLLATYRCNLHCSYCYEPKQASSQMDAERMKEYIIHETDKLGDGYDEIEVQFMGGEPLMVFPMVKEVSEWLWQYPLGKRLKVIFAPTNGTLLDEGMKPWLVANKERFCLGLSFDGDNIMQDANRSGSFRNVDLKFFADTWPEQSVKMTVSPQTIGQLAKGVDFLFKTGFKEVVADLAVGKKVVWNATHLKTFRNELRKLVDEYADHPEKPRFSMLDMDMDSVFSRSADDKACACGELLTCIDADGTDYACHLFSPIACDREKAVDSRYIDFSDHAAFISPKCKKCLLKGVCKRCAGMNYICTGDVAETSPFHCSATKILFYENCRLQYLRASKANDGERMAMIEKITESIS